MGQLSYQHKHYSQPQPWRVLHQLGFTTKNKVSLVRVWRKLRVWMRSRLETPPTESIAKRSSMKQETPFATSFETSGRKRPWCITHSPQRSHQIIHLGRSMLRGPFATRSMCCSRL